MGYYNYCGKSLQPGCNLAVSLCERKCWTSFYEPQNALNKGLGKKEKKGGETKCAVAAARSANSVKLPMM